jgi:streptogrisin B
MELTSSVRRATTALAAAGLVAGMVLLAPSAALAAPSATDAQVASATADLESSSVAGTAWTTDAASNTVTVTVDSTVTGAKLQQIVAVAQRNSKAVRVQHTSGTFTPLVSGGDAIYNAGGRCSLGFNVRVGSTFYFLTAGHCTNLGGNWYTNSSRTTLIGPTAGSRFPGDDFGAVRYSNTSLSHPGTVGSLRVTGAANPSVGTRACRRGSTTGTQCGTVTGLNATVNYGGGNIVRGLIQTNICADRGDSGGSMYSNTSTTVTAYGLTSGGNLDCGGSPVTFFQPVVEALNSSGATIHPA